MDENERLWQRFAHTGRVADYLRYRGVALTDATAGIKGDQTFDQRDKTAPDHRGADPAGISQYRGK